MGHKEQSLSHNMEEILLDIAKDLLPWQKGKFFIFRLWFFYLGIIPFFIVISSPGHPLRVLPYPLLPMAISKMDVGKYALLGNYITFSAPFSLVQVWVS